MQKKGNIWYHKNIGSAALFALAMSILVVSCPLKRLLTNNFSSQTSTLPKSKSTNSNRALSVFYSSSSTTCYTDTYKAAILQADKIQQVKTVIPFFTDNIFNYTGYFIHAFLNKKTADYNLIPVVYSSSLPLFLRHRSILI